MPEPPETGTTWSQSIQESEERVWRAVAAGFAVQWLGAGERAFFECEVGVEVHLRGFDLFMSEPQRDHGGVDAGVKQPHRGGVAQDVRRDRLGGQRRAALGGVGGVLGDPAGERFAGERRAGAGREQGIGGRTGTFGEPHTEHRGGLLGQRGDPLLAALACRRRRARRSRGERRRSEDRSALRLAVRSGRAG